jgi:hypothetical protein
MEVNLTIAEVFRKVNLSPRGPVPWGKLISESSAGVAGVYVVARVRDPGVGCKACALPFIDPLPAGLNLQLESEQRRWLPNEPVVYIGQTGRTIRERVGEFYRQKCGDKRPHAGGQVVGLLGCKLWVYWSPAIHPRDSERTMICAFKEQTGQEPFANSNRRRRRIQSSN